jgi:hypothetical protein
MRGIKNVAVLLLSGTLTLIVALEAKRFFPDRLHVSVAAEIPRPAFDDQRMRLVLPNRYLVAAIGSYRDELLAYLVFDYLKSRHIAGMELLLTCREGNSVPSYHVLAHLPNDLLSATPLLIELEQRGLIDGFDLRYEAQVVLERQRSETHVFMTAYSMPVHSSLEKLPASTLRAGTRAFVMFKSMTDPRTRPSALLRLRRLDLDEARRLATDIIAVADFFELPLDLFLGIGAMENNYLNVAGDLKHTAWKRRAEPGDIVVLRRRNRVMVQNSALGLWQITRETLRYAHLLFLRDRRNYDLLPERLRPPRALDLDHTRPEVLTTYAGLLFRSLLDRFDGDVGKAVGAYNGGPANPIVSYEHGVSLVATYARTILEHFAAANTGSVAREFSVTAGILSTSSQRNYSGLAAITPVMTTECQGGARQMCAEMRHLVRLTGLRDGLRMACLLK